MPYLLIYFMTDHLWSLVFGLVLPLMDAITLLLEALGKTTLYTIVSTKLRLRGRAVSIFCSLPFRLHNKLAHHIRLFSVRLWSKKSKEKVDELQRTEWKVVWEMHLNSCMTKKMYWGTEKLWEENMLLCTKNIRIVVKTKEYLFLIAQDTLIHQ